MVDSIAIPSSVKKKRRKSTPAERSLMVSAYLAGDSIEAAAAKYGFTPPVCEKALKLAGVYRKKLFHPSAEQLDDMVFLYLSGLTLKEASRRDGFSESALRKELIARGIPFRRGGSDIWPQELLDDFAARYPEEGRRKLASDYGLTIHQINGQAERLNLKSRNKGKFVGDALANKNRSVNWRYFETWSPNMAWLLGYIWADAGITRLAVRFGCVTDDEAILFSIRNELQSTHEITRTPAHYNCQGYLCRPFTRFIVSSRKLAQSLIEKHGILPNKSYLDLPFPNVPDEFLRHFARGNLDGDGSAIISARGTATIKFLGSHQFIRGLQKQICEQTGLRPNKIGKAQSPKLSHFQWGHHDDIVTLHSWLYPSPDVFCLQRKRLIIEAGANAVVRYKSRLRLTIPAQ